MPSAQLELSPATPLFTVRAGHPNIELLVRHLAGTDWQTSNEILSALSQPLTEHNRRWLRALANASGGRVAGGQRGYKLIDEMTKGEFDHWINWMTSQADQMRRRVIEAKKRWYKTKPL